ncbi:hypothetical protein DFR58_103200 [Anaerobacterium chartisolvens]|uniref:Uncharacterized protein n=1 Tax=Anaerobacterium chartisolvens TaxID=1297424 RepID=A0A369BD36_9FIRM|nr:hypothetical protein [Anaerobacterium chartisolvens]RCX19453.1 hypothetical protein DFR58_103200 [Anaerobacterium chartisolvens]
MEIFKTKLRKRLVIAGVYNGFVIILFAMGYMVSKRYDVPDIAVGFTMGFFVGLQFVIIYYMAKYAAALKIPEKLKLLYIEENDERKKFIESKISSIALNIVLGGIIFATIVSGFIDGTVFFTLMITMILSLLVKGILKLYYRKKV